MLTAWRSMPPPHASRQKPLLKKNHGNVRLKNTNLRSPQMFVPMPTAWPSRKQPFDESRRNRPVAMLIIALKQNQRHEPKQRPGILPKIQPARPH